MPHYVEFEDQDGVPTGYTATLDKDHASPQGRMITFVVTDRSGFRVARGECSEHELRSLAQGDWDSSFRLTLPEERDHAGSPVAITMRAYPMGMLEAHFGGQVQYLQRAQAFEGLRTLFPN